MRIFLALLAFLVSIPAVADQKLVADCADDAALLLYRVYQDTSDPSGQSFSAENVRADQSLPVDQLINDAGTVLWVANVRSEQMFMLSVNLQDTTADGSDAILVTDGFEGHVRCKISL